MKAHKRLMAALNGNKNEGWKRNHPIASGLIPVTTWLAPIGTYTPAMRDTSASQARFAVETLRGFIASLVN